MVSNFENRFKTPTALFIKDKQILFGEKALEKKFVDNDLIFNYMHDFIGKTYEDYTNKINTEELEIDKYFHKFNYTENIHRKSFKFKVKFNNEQFNLNIEEILGLFFSHIKNMVYQFSKLRLKTCIITIPCSYTYTERNIIFQALQIANMKAISFINANTAAAVHFALGFKFNKNETRNSIFYNIGSSSTQASLVKFTMENSYDKETNLTTYNKTIEVYFI